MIMNVEYHVDIIIHTNLFDATCSRRPFDWIDNESCHQLTSKDAGEEDLDDVEKKLCWMSRIMCWEECPRFPEQSKNGKHDCNRKKYLPPKSKT